MYCITDWVTLPGNRSDCIDVSSVFLIFRFYFFAICLDEYPKLVFKEAEEEGKLGCVCRD